MSRPTPEAARSAVSPSQAISTATTIALSTIHTLMDRSLRTARRTARGPRPIGPPYSAPLGYACAPRPNPGRHRTVSAYVDGLMADVEAKNPGELEFHQAVREVATSIELLLDRKPVHRGHQTLDD